jgi:hypothetical protein
MDVRNTRNDYRRKLREFLRPYHTTSQFGEDGLGSSVIFGVKTIG